MSLEGAHTGFAHIGEVDLHANYWPGFVKGTIAVSAALLLAPQCSDAQLSASDVGYIPLPLGASASRSIVVTNRGTAEAIIGDVAFRVTSPSGTTTPALAMTGGTCLSTRRVAPDGGTCTIEVTYAPGDAGETRAELDILYTWAESGTGDRLVQTSVVGGAPNDVLLRREGDQFWTPTWVPGWYAGARPIGSSTETTFTLHNLGPWSLTLGPLTNESLGLAPHYALSGGTCASRVTVPQGGSCTLIVAFQPLETGRFTAHMIVPFVWSNGWRGRELAANLIGDGR
ncbi:MAG TPA: choice-of-anchor D domain-containing protein [Polyangiaceae bacterium]